MTMRPQLVRSITPIRAGLPPTLIADLSCPVCGLNVRVPIVREFITVWRRVCALAGITLSADTPMSVYQCKRGHYVTVSLDKLEQAR